MSILEKASYTDNSGGMYCICSDPEENSCCLSIQADAFKGAFYRKIKL